MEANNFIDREKSKGLHVIDEVPMPGLVYIVGIDPGINTGFALYDKQEKRLIAVMTIQVHQAFDIVKRMNQDGIKLFVRVEDARKRKRYGPNSNAKIQGAGAIKIQCRQWEMFLQQEGISFDLVAPAKIKTKVDAKKFKMITGWAGRTSNHARDAAMLVYGL